MKDFLKRHSRYAVVAAILSAAFLYQHNFFVFRHVKFDDCQEGQCVPVAEFGQLSWQRPFFIIPERLDGRAGGWYRLTFKAKASQPVSLKLNIVNDAPLGEVAAIDIPRSSEFRFYQKVFRAPADFRRINLTMEEAGAGANIFLERAVLTPLAVKTEEEALRLSPAELGNMRAVSDNQEQRRGISDEFDQLARPETVLGQTFKAEYDNLDGVSLFLDYFTSHSSSRQYILELRSVDVSKDSIRPQKGKIVEFKFSIDGLEEFRQPDGSFYFPLVAKLKKGRIYLISIDNQKVSVDRENRLVWRGVGADGAYENGSVIMRRDGAWQKISGDLAFVAQGAVRENDLLNGASLEPISPGVGRYLYRSQGQPDDFFDIRSSNKELAFHAEHRVISAKSEEVAGEIKYEFELRHPFRSVKISAEQVNHDWCPIKLFASQDDRNWKELAHLSQFVSEEEAVLVFADELLGDGKKERISVKVVCEAGSDNDTRFGVKNLRLDGELIMPQ